jgi:hypothetical protein
MGSEPLHPGVCCDKLCGWISGERGVIPGPAKLGKCAKEASKGEEAVTPEYGTLCHGVELRDEKKGKERFYTLIR